MVAVALLFLQSSKVSTTVEEVARNNRNRAKLYHEEDKFIWFPVVVTVAPSLIQKF